MSLAYPKLKTKEWYNVIMLQCYNEMLHNQKVRTHLGLFRSAPC